MPKERLQRIGLYAALGFATALTLFPLLWMISVSFMPSGEANAFPPPFLPSRWTFEHYASLFDRLNMGRYLMNSFGLALAATAVSLWFNATAGYAFAKLRFAGRDRIFKTLMGALVIPAQVSMLPLFVMLRYMGLVNSYAGILIPVLASIFGIFLIRQYALSIPDSLIEAARIDGATEWETFRKIILPLLYPILATLAIFTFMGTWNDFMWPLIVLTDSEKQTLPVALAALSGEHVQDNELMMAGSVVTVLPVLIVFLAMQRYYMKGIMMGGTKE